MRYHEIEFRRRPRSRPSCRVDTTRPKRHAVVMSQADRIRLGTALSRRRGRLKLTQRDFAEHAGIEVKQLQRIEAGKVANPRSGTLEGLDTAARWPSGTCQGILDGNPSPEDPPDWMADEGRVRELAAMTRDEIVEAAKAIDRVDGSDAADDFIWRAYEAKRQVRKWARTTTEATHDVT